MEMGPSLALSSANQAMYPESSSGETPIASDMLDSKVAHGLESQPMHTLRYPQHSPAMKRFRNDIASTYPGLNVLDLALDTLHIFKSGGLCYGNPSSSYLPAFHIIAKVNDTVSNLQLFAYNGKLVEEKQYPNSVSVTDLSELESLSRDALHLCQGVQEVKSEQLESFLRGTKIPLLEKVRSIFLIEQISQQVLLRSRLCAYMVINRYAYY